ncbi:uncharacterized protein MELLADRAFT_67775 [Melampsora larici-populina 98AG31]|uniref:Major facilitator superfamily (MFS) profile domain-containing protein n=1 Tax=Melampsora larici-populina (strain 98AG31 / pathotype 3-4-7) TaxID=747676 RepID=F4S488_MELLP|nr:uncharacterized protein MELLADRAFT_67775 [Melampsora larici-populina 98AG31]EGG00546.1 hypothetical protein MELLADRAFT_67775 [Melampsora larici-populina 98AG31]
MPSDYPLYDSRNSSHEAFRRKVVRKIDLYTIPCVVSLYLACFVDRSNIGNAKHRQLCDGENPIKSHFAQGGGEDLVAIFGFLLGCCEDALGTPGKLHAEEGILTILVAAVVWFFLSSSLETAPYLNSTEREFAVMRLRRFEDHLDNTGVKLKSTGKKSEDQTVETEASYETEGGSPGPEAFEWIEVRRAFSDPQVWLIGLSDISFSIPLAGLSFFLPTWSALLADRWGIRGPIVLACVPVGIIGCKHQFSATVKNERFRFSQKDLYSSISSDFKDSLLIFSNGTTTRYAAFFLIFSGLFPVIPCIACIIPINTSGATKRATCVGIQGMIQGMALLIGPFIYIKGDPVEKGHKISLALICTTWLFTAANVLYCQFENSRKSSGRRDHLLEQYREKFRAGETRAPIGDRHPKFRFTL